MNRRVVVGLILVSLVVSAVPVSAAVASINTTDTDFAAATLDDMDITGSGESASVTGEVGLSERVDMGFDTGETSVSAERGLVFSVSSDRGAVFADTATVSTSPDTMYLRFHANGTLIDSKSFSNGDVVSFEHDFVSGTEYRLTVDKGGDNYNAQTYDPSLPLSSGDMTVTHGYAFGGEFSEPYHFEDISTGSAADVSYVGAEHSADADTLFADVQTSGAATIEAQANSGSGWSVVDSTTISSNQNVSLDISGSSATRYRTGVESSETGSERTVTLEDEGVTFTSSSPTLSNPDPVGATGGYGGGISVDVTDADFSLAQGDIATVNASVTGGSEIGETQTNTNGTVSLEYSATGGANNITWVAVDEYGNSDTIQQNFTTTAELLFVNSSNTSEIVDAPVTVTVQLLGENETVERTSDTGRVSLQGVPVDDPLLATVEASSGYEDTVVYISSLQDQSTVYLLSNNVSTVDTRFELQDPTGQFSSQSYLFIRKPINESGNITFQTVYADRFGVEGVTATLEEGERYRLRVRSTDGVTQDIGPYRADVSETVTVRPGSPSITIGNYSEGWDAAAGLDNTTLEYRYSDPENETDSVTVWIHEKGDPSSQLAPNQTYFNLGEVQASESLTTNESQKTWVVNFVVDRGTEEFVAQEIVANQPNLVPDLSKEWRLIFGIGILLISAGMFSVLNAGVGGVVVAIEGGLLWWTGWLEGATTGAGVVLALMIAAFAHLYKTRRL